MTTPDFLNWMADRLVHVYHESPNVDFVLRLREIAKTFQVPVIKPPLSPPLPLPPQLDNPVNVQIDIIRRTI